MRITIPMSFLALFATSVLANWEAYGTTSDNEPTASTTTSKAKVCKPKSTTGSVVYDTTSSYPTGGYSTTTITVTVSGYPTEGTSISTTETSTESETATTSSTQSETATTTATDSTLTSVSTSDLTSTTSTTDSTTETTTTTTTTSATSTPTCGAPVADTCTDGMTNTNEYQGTSCPGNPNCVCVLSSCGQQLCVRWVPDYTCNNDCDVDSDCGEGYQCISGTECNRRDENASGGNTCMFIDPTCLNAGTKRLVRAAPRMSRRSPVNALF